MKALPISKMKKHELEHSIDAMKKLKMEKAATPVGPPAKAGRPLSRPVQAEQVEDEGLVLTVPKVLKERQVEKRSVKKPVEEHLDTSSLFPGVVKRTAETAAKRQFGTAVKPVVVVQKEDSDEEMAKKVKKLHAVNNDHNHACNCSGCPKKLVGKFLSFD
jgi:hypothetical protein